MNGQNLIRAYENTELPLEERLPSLARRFPSLRKAAGLEPWDPAALAAWMRQQGEGSAGWHAGAFVLSLLAGGSWPSFNVAAAVRCWDTAERQAFANWALSWRE